VLWSEPVSWVQVIKSDTPLFDYLVMREFVSGPPSYHPIHMC